MTVVQQSSWSGPLPPPQSLQQFNDVVPNGAERIFVEWEAEMAHRRKFENRALTAEIVERVGSKLLAFALASGCIAVAVYLAIRDKTTVAGIIGGTTVVSLVGAFIYGKTREKADK